MKITAKLYVALSLPLLALTAAGQSDGPSFECKRARTSVDKTICADAQLAALDRQLADLLAHALERSSEPGEIKRAQRQWLRERNACKAPTCIKNVYDRRIEELTTLTGKFSISFVRSLCTIMTSPEERSEALARTTGAEDLNNDGVADTTCASAPCAVSIGSTLDAASATQPEPGPETDLPLGRAAFRYSGRTFIYSSSDTALELPLRVSYITPTGREVRLCDLQTVIGSAVVEGGHDVCAAVESNVGFEPIEPARLAAPASDAFGRAHTQLVGEGTIDVDNDGFEERVVELRYDRDPACAVNYFELLAEDGRSLLEGSKSAPLRELQQTALKLSGRSECGHIQNRFLKFADKTYYETNVTNDSAMPHEIYALEGTAVAKVCTLERYVETRIKNQL